MYCFAINFSLLKWNKILSAFYWYKRINKLLKNRLWRHQFNIIVLQFLWTIMKRLKIYLVIAFFLLFCFSWLALQFFFILWSNLPPFFTVHCVQVNYLQINAKSYYAALSKASSVHPKKWTDHTSSPYNTNRLVLKVSFEPVRNCFHCLVDLSGCVRR